MLRKMELVCFKRQIEIDVRSYLRPSWLSLPSFSLFAVADGEIFFFVGFAMASHSIEQSASIVWFVSHNIVEVRVRRPGAVG